MPKKSSIRSLLSYSENSLSSVNILTPRLDAEVLLAYVLGVDRSWLHANSEEELGAEKVRDFEALVERRAKREPVAYIVGKKEFYGRDFTVTPDTLIPRPETEDLVELALKLEGESRRKVLDVGCGSGAVGITLKLEQPEWGVTLSDISEPALAVARQNAQNLSANVKFIFSDIFSGLRSQIFDLIVANLPYVDRDWETSPETAFEPSEALYANDNGLELIFKLIEQARDVLSPNGYLLLEADPEQHEAIRKHAEKNGLSYDKTQGYTIRFANQP